MNLLICQKVLAFAGTAFFATFLCFIGGSRSTVEPAPVGNSEVKEFVVNTFLDVPGFEEVDGEMAFVVGRRDGLLSGGTSEKEGLNALANPAGGFSQLVGRDFFTHGEHFDKEDRPLFFGINTQDLADCFEQMDLAEAEFLATWKAEYEAKFNVDVEKIEIREYVETHGPTHYYFDDTIPVTGPSAMVYFVDKVRIEVTETPRRSN